MTEDRRRRLLAEEDAAWREFHNALDSVGRERAIEPLIPPEGWSARDVMFHVGAWLADCGRALEQMRAGTFVDEEVDTDAQNRLWFELSRTLDLETCRAELEASHARTLQEFGQMPQITAEVQEWFEESGALHYRKHLEDLRNHVLEL